MKFVAPLGPGEQVITCNRAHPAKLVRPGAVLLLGIFLSSLVQVLAQGRAGWSLVAPVLLLAALWYALDRLVRWLLTGYALTTQRVVVFRGLRRKKPVSLPLERLSGVHGPGRSLWGSSWGTVTVGLGGRALELTYQQRPREFVALCQQTAARRFRALGWAPPGV